MGSPSAVWWPLPTDSVWWIDTECTNGAAQRTYARKAEVKVDGTPPPGESAESRLVIVLGPPTNVRAASEEPLDAARGVFLPASYRMHPRLCGLVSELVYEGQLQAHASTAERTPGMSVAIAAPLPCTASHTAFVF